MIRRQPGSIERLLGNILTAPRHGFRLGALGVRRSPIEGLLVSAMKAGSFVGRWTLRAAGRFRSLAPQEIRRIAFIKLDHLGDVIQAQPLLRALRAKFPSAHITVFARSASTELLLRMRYADEIETADVPWINPGTGAVGNLRACLSLAGRLRRRAFDLAVDLRYHNRLDSLLLSLSGARFRLGFDAQGLGFWLTHRADWPTARHELERQSFALAQFGIPLESPFPVMEASDEEMTKAAAWLSARSGNAGPTVTMHVGAGNPVKRWMPERFAWVARELVRRARARIVLLSGRDEWRAGSPLADWVPARSLVDLRGVTSIGEMAAVMKLSSIFIGNDGGAAHIAAAAGAPCLIIFSGTNTAEQWAPVGPCVSVLEKWVPCKPCGRTECPYEQSCLRKVRVDEVLDKACAMLAGRSQLHDNTRDADG